MNQRVVIRYLYMDDIAQFALQTLRDLSPIGNVKDPHPGLYRDSHMMFIDGHNVPDAKNWQPGQQIEISNPVPYSRIIELGNGKMRAPLNVYEKATPSIVAFAARYSNSINVQFLFMPVRFGSIQAYSQSLEGRAARKRRGGSRKALRDWLVRQPAIIITAR
jgi:hypothetical protein